MTSLQPLNPSRHIPALDGLRGFAVLMVFYYHTCNVPTVPAHWRIFAGMGWSGVDLFFVLSGYLITNILVSSRDSITYYTSFYARRALRIGPVYYLALAIIIFVQPHLYHHMHPLRPIPAYSWHQQALYWFNLSNLRSAFYPIEIPLASIYWSLAIEEQFYALWPAIVRRVTNRTILIVCICEVSLSMLLRCLPTVQAWNHTYDNFIYRLTPFRLDGLLLGALLASICKAVQSLSAFAGSPLVPSSSA